MFKFSDSCSLVHYNPTLLISRSSRKRLLVMTAQTLQEGQDAFGSWRKTVGCFCFVILQKDSVSIHEIWCWKKAQLYIYFFNFLINTASALCGQADGVTCTFCLHFCRCSLFLTVFFPMFLLLLLMFFFFFIHHYNMLHWLCCVYIWGLCVSEWHIMETYGQWPACVYFTEL